MEGVALEYIRSFDDTDDMCRVSAEIDTKPLYGAAEFNAKGIACVVLDEARFLYLTSGLQHLGFEVACSSCLDTTFKVVSEDPQEWAMVVVVLDQPEMAERLESYVRLIRMMDFRVPFLIVDVDGATIEASSHAKRYEDCVVREPRSITEISDALRVGVDSDIRWASRFHGLRHAALSLFAERKQA